MSRLRNPDIQNQLWTIISAGVSSIYMSLLILITTRSVGLGMAGLIAFAVALCDPLKTIALFGGRSYQCTDVRQEFNFNVYMGFRTITTGFATIIFLAILLVSQFELYMIIVLVLVYFVNITEAYADVFEGDFQQKGKMRLAGRMKTSAFLTALSAYAIVVVISGNILLALAASGASLLFVYVGWIWMTRFHFGAVRVRFDILAIRKLGFAVFPLLVSGVLSVFLNNAQKYYLNAYVSEEAVAVFTIIILPVSLLNLFFTFFFSGAEVTRTAEILASGDMKKLIRRVNLQMLLALGFCIPFMAAMAFGGINILSWLYNVDLTVYRTHIFILSLGALFMAPNRVLGPVLTAMRYQKMFMYTMLGMTATAGPLMWWLVMNHGLVGAAFINIAIQLPLLIVVYLTYRVACKRISEGKDLL